MEREEAIRRIKAWNLDPDDMEVLATAIPELRESEDERIRKSIIHILQVGGYMSPEEKDKAIDYLEKQKEQKPKDITLSREDCLHQLFENGTITMADYLYLTTNRRKQKPAEKQDYSGLNDFERAIHRGFLSAGVENVPVTIIKETAKECLAQMKPAEWSDTKELVFKDICKHLKEEGYDGWVVLLEALHSGEFKQPVAEWSEEDDWKRKELIQYLEEKGDYRTVWMTWLKSIPERFNLEPKEEWSKEDEKMLTELLLTIEPSNNYDEMRNWLLLKLKALLLQGSKDSLQTSWKPSEEQMEAL